MKRIGDILIANGWIEPSILQRALVKQKETGHRLCSLLVLGGALGADDAACALGEQHGVAAALQRHLTHRDRSLAPLLSAALARACIALPIGRMGNGVVIVCVRDPSPELETQLARAMKETIKLAVAPARQLEELVLEAYGADDANEFDIDLSTGPIMSLELDDEESIEPLSDEALADLGSLELVDLDDTSVSKDESQTQPASGKRRRSTLPPTTATVDAPTLRPSTAPVVDAPSYRSSAAIVVDAPSQRVPPGRAALSAAGIAVARTQTPPGDALGNELQSGLDPASAATPREHAPRGRAALAAAGPAIARTVTPPPSEIHAEITVPRTRTPGRAAIDDEPAIDRARTPARPSLAAAAVRAIESVAAAESAAVAASLAAASAAAAELMFDDEPAVILPAPIEPPERSAPAITLPDPAPAATAPKAPAPAATAPKALAPATPGPKPVSALPSIAPPRADGLRPPPAALSALQRASSAVSRVPNIPPRPIPSALPPRPSAAPTAVAQAPEAIAVGTQLPTAALAVSPRLADALAALLAAPSIDRVCDALMTFSAKRWSAAMLLDIEGMTATGRRGHGAQISDDLAQWVVMSLEESSLLQAAYVFNEVATVTPRGHGDVEHRLQQLLGVPRSPSALAISVAGKPLLILAVGDPDGDDVKTALADLERLGNAAGAALTRLRGR